MKKIVQGLYFLYKGKELVYIGQSDNILYRIGTHIHEGEKDFDNWSYVEVADKSELIRKEGELINIFTPKYNVQVPPSYDVKRYLGSVNEKMDTTLKILNTLDYLYVRQLYKMFKLDWYPMWDAIKQIGIQIREDDYGDNYIYKRELIERLKEFWETYDNIKCSRNLE